MVMAAAEHGGPGPDLYQLLGSTPGASGGEITRAWRRRARPSTRTAGRAMPPPRPGSAP